MTSHQRAVYVNKSLSFIGFGSKARITCTNGHVFIFDGSKNNLQMKVTLRNLEFHGTPVNFLDSAAEIYDCTFSDVAHTSAINTTLVTKPLVELSVNDSLFQNNSACVSVVIDKKPNEKDTPTRVSINVTKTTFRDNKASRPNDILFSVTAASWTALTCDVAFRNVSFLKTSALEAGVVLFDLQRATSSVLFEKVVFDKTEERFGILQMSYCTLLSERIRLTISESTFLGQVGRAVKIVSHMVMMQVLNSRFSGLSVGRGGGPIFVESEGVCRLFVFNCTFLNTSATFGGAIYLSASRSIVEVRDSYFTGNKAVRGGGALYTEGRQWLNLTIANSTFEYTTSRGDGGAVSTTSRNISVLIRHSKFLNRGKEQYEYSHGGALSIRVDVSSLSQTVNSTSDTHAICLTVQNTSFIGNIATFGGAIGIFSSPEDSHLATGYVILSGVVMKSTRAFASGGGVYFGGMKSLTVEVTHSVFENNQAGALGGAIWAEGLSRVQLMKSSFKSCFSSGPGGALWLGGSPEKGSNVFIANCSFINDTSDGYGGGGNLLGFYKYHIVHSEFMHCASLAGPGGGLCLSYSQQSSGNPTTVSFYIEHSSFINNSANAPGGGIYIDTYSTFELAHSVFQSCFTNSVGGGLYIVSTNFSRTNLVNTSFTSCSAANVGGAIYASLAQHSNFSLNGCDFLNNSARQGPGGAILLTMTSNRLINPGCVRCNAWRQQSISITDNEKRYRTWEYTNNVLFTNTSFEANNAPFGGAVLLQNGQTRFNSCFFSNNFALTRGGHVATVGEPTSGLFHNCTFLQTQTQLQRMGITYSRSSFISTTSAGPLVLKNTTLDSRIWGNVEPILTVSKGGLVDFGDHNKSHLLCGRGSRMELENFTNEFQTEPDCTIRVTVLQFSCKTCSTGLYSLQRGQALGLQVLRGFQPCQLCPYGANCTRSIIAGRNFWGHELQTDPVSLRFSFCPLGYCRPPEHQSSQLEYNACQGNRTGYLCGKCKRDYTENLYSSHCRPIDNCKDHWFWPLAFLFISAMALYLTNKPPNFSTMSRHIFWFKARETEMRDQASFDRGYMKIVFYFYQTANLLLISTSPSVLLQTYLISPIVGFFNFQQTLTGTEGLLCPVPGLNAVTKQLFYVSYVIGTLMMIHVIYGIKYAVYMIRGRGAPSLGPYIGAIIEALLLGYSSVVTVSFSLLRCVPIGSEKRLFIDGNVVCLRWWQYLIVAFIVGFAVPFIVVLAWGSLKFYKKTVSVQHFVLACVFPLPCLLSWTFACFFSRQDECEHNQQWMESLERVLYQPFRKPEEGEHVISWESVLIGRRFLLIILHTTITDPVTRLLSMTFTCVLILLHHSVKQPFRDPKANLAETVSLLSLVALATINVFLSIFPSLDVVAKGPLLSQLAFCAWLEAVILGLLPVLFALALVMIVMSQCVRLLLWGCKVICTCWECCCHSSEIDKTQDLLCNLGQE